MFDVLGGLAPRPLSIPGSRVLVACGVASDVRVQFPYVLVVCVTVGRPVNVDWPFLVLGMMNTRRRDAPGGEWILNLLGECDQLAWWAHVGGIVAFTFGWWVSGREGPLRNDTVNQQTGPFGMLRTRRSKRESEGDISLAKVVHDVSAWSHYPGRVDGFRREPDHPCGFRGEPCRLRTWPADWASHLCLCARVAGVVPVTSALARASWNGTPCCPRIVTTLLVNAATSGAMRSSQDSVCMGPERGNTRPRAAMAVRECYRGTPSGRPWAG